MRRGLLLPRRRNTLTWTEPLAAYCGPKPGLGMILLASRSKEQSPFLFEHNLLSFSFLLLRTYLNAGFHLTLAILR